MMKSGANSLENYSTSRCLEKFFLHDQEYLEFVDSWYTTSQRLALKDLPDFHLICPGSSENSLLPDFTLPAVVPAYIPDDHQDDSSDIALDPVLQSVI
ncbi:unnamed protein product [Rhizophagus irregularis]|nr:unnamed protein product [Rhizophagus irregularis]